MKRVVAVIAVLVLAVTTFAAVGLAIRGALPDDGGPTARPTPSPTTPPPASVTEAPAPDLADLYSQRIDWQPCETNDDHDCGFLTVPVDYSEPQGETIELALLRVPASGERVGSMVVNPGGPGARGTSYAAAAGQVFREPLLQGFDVVGFDPRGVGRSAPVDCLSDEELNASLAGDPTPDTPEEQAAFKEGVLSYGDKCVANSGPVVGHVTTTEAARDMDVLRSALGEETLTYFGASYGTKLGATYAELFPEQVGRFVLDGAVDVALDPQSLSLDQAEGFETALRAYVQNCLDSTDNCFLGDSVEEGLDTISGLLDTIEEEPLPAGDRELTVGNAFYGIITPLYNRDYWFLLSTALASALEGKGSALMQLADAYASRNADGTYARQLGRGQLRHQLPRRPDVGAVRRGAVAVRGLRGGVADLRPRLRLGDDELPRHRGDLERGAADDPWRGRRADRRARHQPRPRDAAEVGAHARRPARLRGARRARR